MYTKGETWQLLHVGGRSTLNRVGSKTSFSRVEFFLHIERARIYHLLNVILPAVFLSAVQVMFFLVPVTHPQRVGSSTTTLLSVVVFQTVAISHLPNTSTDVPLLTIYIFFVVIVSSLSVITSIVVAKMAVYADQQLKIPKWLQKIPHPLEIFCCRHRKSNIGEKIDLENIFIHPTTEHQHQQAHCSICSQSPVHLPSIHEPVRLTASLNYRNWEQSDRIVRNQLSSPPSNSKKNRSSENWWMKPGSPIIYRRQTSPIVSANYQTVTLDRTLPNPMGLLINEQPQQQQQQQQQPAIGPRQWLKNWEDVSNAFDFFLMMVAATIALITPIVLFVIVPNLAEPFDPNNPKYIE